LRLEIKTSLGDDSTTEQGRMIQKSVSRLRTWLQAEIGNRPANPEARGGQRQNQTRCSSQQETRYAMNPTPTAHTPQKGIAAPDENELLL
jgi:hypothetical protein